MRLRCNIEGDDGQRRGATADWDDWDAMIGGGRASATHRVIPCRSTTQSLPKTPEPSKAPEKCHLDPLRRPGTAIPIPWLSSRPANDASILASCGDPPGS